MEPGGSLPYSQEPATCPYPEPDQSSPCPLPPSHFLQDYLTCDKKLPKHKHKALSNILLL
jgi:hypothetical protein